jgi:hypothetical protein
MDISFKNFRDRSLTENHLPEGLVIKDSVTINWNLTNCWNLTNFILPENLTIEGFLDLEGCTLLTHLPSGLVVRGALDLRGCSSLTNLPPDLKAGKIFCDKKLIDTIPKEDLPLYINFNFEKVPHEYFTTRLQ